MTLVLTVEDRIDRYIMGIIKFLPAILLITFGISQIPVHYSNYLNGYISQEDAIKWSASSFIVAIVYVYLFSKFDQMIRKPEEIVAFAEPVVPME